MISRLKTSCPSLSQEPGVDAVEVVFNFHYGYYDYCQFSGKGTWDRGRLHLRSKAKHLAPTCRLSLARQGKTIRVLDPGGACRATLCTAPGPSIDGLSFELAQ